jgi:hypothetical protein
MEHVTASQNHASVADYECVLHGLSPNQMMAQHEANHIHVAYANAAATAEAMMAKAECFRAMGMEVSLCCVSPA